MSLLLASTIDITLLLALAFAVTRVLRRRSAALRHAILAAAIVCSAAIPLLEAAMPPWALPVLEWGAPSAATPSTLRLTSNAAPASADTSAAAAQTAPSAFNWIRLAAGAWALGTLVSLAGLITGLVRLARITTRCAIVRRGRWRDLADELAASYALRRVTVLQSRERALLVTCGVLNPKIVLPAGSDAWSDTRRRVVLTHELAHIRRGDWAFQLIAETLRAVYWFHPLVWLVCRRLRQESEYACDDAVLARGVTATEYATHLLDVARHAVGRRDVWAAAPAIAHPSTLERRIAAMLSERSRTPLSPRTIAAIVCAMVALAVPLAAASITGRTEAAQAIAALDVPLTGEERLAPAPGAAAPAARVTAPTPPPAQEKPATISGTIYDQLGGLLPGVGLTLTDNAFGVTYTSTTDRNGKFVFEQLQPGTYELQTELPGFARVSTVMPIVAGAAVERRITLPIGSLEETITVGCQASERLPDGAPRPVVRARAVSGRGLPPPPSTAAVPFSGGIGGQIRVPYQIERANPICPNQVGVDTVVQLAARVGIDGYLSDVRLVNRSDEKPAPEIVESAVEAVRLWKYTPTLLNGVPVEVNITMTVFYNW